MEKLENTTEILSGNNDYYLNGNDFLVLSNIIIYNATICYKTNFNSNKMPSTFLKFYINELSGYDYLFDTKLYTLFSKLNNETQLTVTMRTFLTSYPMYAVKITNSDLADILEFNNESISKDVLEYCGNSVYLKSSIEALNLIISHYNNSDELRSIPYLFKDYLYNAFKGETEKPSTQNEPVQNINNEPNDNTEIDKNLEELPNDNNYIDIEEPSKTDFNTKKSALLTGRAIEAPKQKGKVISVLFPELPLPTDYPTLFEKSRVNTEKKVGGLLNASREISLINDFRFIQIKYSLDFINKRKVIAYDLKRASRFDFKF